MFRSRTSRTHLFQVTVSKGNVTTYPMSRAQYLLGKVLFNVLIALGQAIVTVALAASLLSVPLRLDLTPLLGIAVVVGTAGWFFFYAIFALRIRRNDAFNTVTSVLAPASLNWMRY